MPTISVIIPTYNRARYIVEAVDSVLVQSRSVDEIIVVDDGSTDNTEEVLRPYGKRIRYIAQRNSGPGAARNRGIREAKGDYIAFLDSDDIWVQNKMKIQMEFFRKHPSLELVFGDMTSFGGSTDFNNKSLIKHSGVRDYLITNSYNLSRLLDYLIEENVIPTPTVILKRTVIDRIGFFDENLRIGEDYDYWLRAVRCCHIGFVNAVLAKRRDHGSNLVKNWAEMNESRIIVLKRILEREPNLPSHVSKMIFKRLSALQYDLGSYYFKNGDFASAYKYLKKGKFSKLLNFKWMLKLIFSSILKHFQLSNHML